LTGVPWLRDLLSGTVKILGLIVIAAAAITLLVLYLLLLSWSVGRYGSAGPDETTWEDYGAVLYLWIPPAVLGGSVGGYLWWVLNEWRYFRTWNRGRGQQLLFFVLGGMGTAVLVYVLFLGFGGAAPPT
jgi:hypothetical protein